MGVRTNVRTRKSLVKSIIPFHFRGFDRTTPGSAPTLSAKNEYSKNPHERTGVGGGGVQADFVLIHRVFSAKLT